jgi:DNA-binding SARP family transcriptional activator
MGMEIRLLGKPAISDAGGQLQAVRGYQAWALLARVLMSARPLSRQDLAAELFPETADPLGSLRWCLASLRKALDCAQALCGDPVQGLLPADTRLDIHALESAEFDIESAGALLEGIEPRCSPAFSTWLLVERERIASRIDARICQEVQRAVAVADHARAIRLAQWGTRRSPFDEGMHILLVKSLASAGRFDAASEHVLATEKLFATELGDTPSPALRSAARRTVSSPSLGVSPRAVVGSLLEYGLAALSAGAAEAGVDCLRRAVAEAEHCHDAQLQARALVELGSALVHSVRGYDNEGALVLGQAVEAAQRCGAARIAATGYRELGYVEALAGRRPTAASYLAQALALAREPGDLADVHGIMGFNLVGWGQLDEGLAHYRLSLQLASSSGNRQREGWSLGLGGWAWLATGRLDEADRWLSDCLKLVDELHWTAFRPWPCAVLCESRLRQNGDPQAIRLELESAFALSCQLGDPCWEAAVARVLGLAYEAMNDAARALQWLHEARKRCARGTDHYVALLVEIVLDQARLSGKLGQAAQADACTREALSLAARAHMDAHVERAVQLIHQGALSRPWTPASTQA